MPAWNGLQRVSRVDIADHVAKRFSRRAAGRRRDARQEEA